MSHYKDEQTYKKVRKKTKRQRKGRVFKRILIVLVVVFFLCGVAGGVYAGIVISKAPKINPGTMYEDINLSTNIYDSDGKAMETIYFNENRKIAHYEELPENLKNAFIAIEDKTFWKHHGFNFKRMFGAVFQAVRGGGEISGTSTVTQQLARNVYLSDIKSQRSIKRKIIEMYYAYELEKMLSKEEIIERYLNTIYLGYGCYGVTSASKTYYSKEVSELSLEECASLAALPQAPDKYALLKGEKDENCKKIEAGLYANDISKPRRDMVLDLMVEQGYITGEEAVAAKKSLMDFIHPGVSTTASNSKTYFKDYLLGEVAKDIMDKYGRTEQEALNMIYTKGLKIYSTLDSEIQKIIVKEFKDDSNFPKTVKGKQPEASMVVVSVEDGAIRAMAGGRHPKGDKLFNRAVSPRQPGSSIKPLAVYGAALQKSYELAAGGSKWEYTDFGYDSQGISGYGDYITAASSVSDEKMIVNGKVWPKNSGGGYSGSNTFRTAIQQSINTCAVKIQLQVGVDYSVEMLKRFGLTTIVADINEPYNDLNSASLALGGLTYGVTPLEMALAYATFPNGGIHNEGYCYSKVEDREGNIILEHKQGTTVVMDEGVAWIMTDVLKSVVSDGIAGGAKLDGVKSGGKTGTTNDKYDIWFDGFTPKYAASLWIGTDNNVALTTLSGPAASLWGKIMNRIPKVKEGAYKDKPGKVITVNGEYYTDGTQPGVIKSNENVLPESDTRTEYSDDISYEAAGEGDE